MYTKTTIAHSRLHKQNQAQKNKKKIAKLCIWAGGVILVAGIILYVRHIAQVRSQLSMKIFVDSSGVTGVLNVPNFSPIIFLGNSVSSVRNLSSVLPFYETKVEDIFLIGGREQNALALEYLTTAYSARTVVRGVYVSDRLDETLTQLSQDKVLVQKLRADVHIYGNVTVGVIYDGTFPNTKSDTRRNNLIVQICARTCIVFGPSPSDFVLRKILKRESNAKKNSAIVLQGIRASVSGESKISQRQLLLSQFVGWIASCSSKCTPPVVIGGSGEYELNYIENGEEGLWQLKQKSSFEL